MTAYPTKPTAALVRRDAWATLQALSGFKRVGDGYKACCPAHDDHEPSLSISRTNDGTILLFCHAGCSTDDILGRLDLQGHDLFLPSDPTITQLYDYRDEKGDLLFQVVRKGHGASKRFYQRRPDGKGGWIPKLDSTRRVPYRLPELLRALDEKPDEPVLVVEGEKDVDRLWSLGFIATTNPGGAKKWRDDYSKYLKGRNVVILPDNDKSGSEHAEQVSASLTSIVTLVTVLPLDGLPDKGDVSEWLDKGHNAEELRLIVQNALRQANTRNEQQVAGATKKTTHATRLVQLALEYGVELWHTQEGDAFASIKVCHDDNRVSVSANDNHVEHREHYSVKSRAFRRWLARLYYRKYGTAVGGQAAQDALGILEGNALFDGSEYPVYVRIAQHEGNYYLDLADADWHAVKITPFGQEVVQNPPVRFRRPRGQLALPMPMHGGSLDELRKFINLSCDQSWPLLAAWLVAALRPTGPYPVLVIVGEQGTAKSTMARILKSIVDPGAAPLRSEPKDSRDLMIAATNSWMPVYDNLSRIQPWLSDALCRLSTGGGLATRELYTDSEETLFDAQRPVAATSIEDIATRGDLLDRAIVVTLEPIPENKRKTEADLWADFEEARPRILGALLDAVSAAMRKLPTIRLDGLPRMADFALWATAAEEALGFKSGTFMEAYSGNRQDASGAALETPVAQKLIKFMADIDRSDEWSGTATELLAGLSVGMDEAEKRQTAWPKDGTRLSGALRRLAPNLRQAASLNVEFPPRQGKKRTRTILITKLESTAASASAASAASITPYSTHETDQNADASRDEADANAYGSLSAASAEKPGLTHETTQADTTDAADAKISTNSKRDDKAELEQAWAESQEASRQFEKRLLTTHDYQKPNDSDYADDSDNDSDEDEDDDIPF
jgi:hypothetical protein